MFDSRSFRTVRTVSGHLLVFACPSGAFSERSKRCIPGRIKVVSVLHPLREFNKLCRHGKCIEKNSRYST